MTLQQFTASLTKENQINLAIKLCKLALPIWDNYANNNKLGYRDTVVGLQHSVDRKLPINTINAVEAYLKQNAIKKVFIGKTKLQKLSKEFDDPIVALQDLDWELPYEVYTFFYSVHNLLETLLGKELSVFGESVIYVSINQAIDALETSKTLTIDQINDILFEVENDF